MQERGKAAAAHAYRALGWAVVPVHSVRDGRCTCGRDPCAAPGKHPRVRWQRFEIDPPSEAQIAAWWRRWPEANVGVLTGPVSRLVVIDIDPRNGGDAAFESIEARVGTYEPTLESDTGGGGRHIWFRTAEPLDTSIIAPGCEVRGAGGLVIAPPSTHYSGNPYRWRPGHGPGELALADAPPWLALLGARRRGSGERAACPRTRLEQEEFARLWARVGVTVRPGDRNYLCPFHDDHHPSLHIDAEGCRWLCFGCRRGGGVGALRREIGEPVLYRPRRRIRTAAAATGEPVTLPGDVDVDVIGESAYQDTLLSITGGVRSYAGADLLTVASLAFEPRARSDTADVEVRIDGRRVGRLRREVADAYHALFTYALREHGSLTCLARIVGGWDRGRDDIGAFGVRVLLPALEDVPPP